MGFDLKRSTFSIVRERELAAGVSVMAEGLVLVHKLENGVGKAALPTPAASEIVIGFSITDQDDNAEKAAAESHVVPGNPGPYTVSLNQALPVGPVANTRVHSLTSGLDMVAGVDYTMAGNVLTFLAAHAGESVVVYYRYSLTVAQARQVYFQRNINRAASGFFGQLGYGCGQGEIYLDDYDSSKDYSSFAPGEGLLVLASGLVSKGAVAGALHLSAHVIHVPSVDSPSLGLEYTILNA